MKKYYSYLYVLNICVVLTNILLFEYEYISLSLYIIFTFLLFKPVQFFHPNTVLTGFYFLYLILPSTIYFFYDLFNYRYIAPWGQVVYWDSFEKLTYIQIFTTFTILYTCFYKFCTTRKFSININNFKISKNVYVLALLTIVTCIYFFYVTGGPSAWFNDYSFTFTTRRAGHGLSNTLLMLLGNVFISILGFKYYQTSSKSILIYAFIYIIIIGYLQGAKSRYIFLIMNFMTVYLLNMKFNIKILSIATSFFFVLLYLTTLIRTNGFYTGLFFIEYLISYFDAFQLHDNVTKDYSMALFQTQHQIFVKPLQILGILDKSIDFDLSVMLTKEYYPDQWIKSNATKQWPLETDLYFNYYGFILSWVVLIPYACLVSYIYNEVIRGNIYILLIYLLEYMRIFTTLRSTIIPYNFTLIIIVYIIIYILNKKLLKKNA